LNENSEVYQLPCQLGCFIIWRHFKVIMLYGLINVAV
jgi:hypothetical protein